MGVKDIYCTPLGNRSLPFFLSLLYISNKLNGGLTFQITLHEGFIDFSFYTHAKKSHILMFL